MSAAGSDALPARQEQELRLKVKTLQPATYEVTAAAEVSPCYAESQLHHQK